MVVVYWLRADAAKAFAAMAVARVAQRVVVLAIAAAPLTLDRHRLPHGVEASEHGLGVAVAAGDSLAEVSCAVAVIALPR